MINRLPKGFLLPLLAIIIFSVLAFTGVCDLKAQTAVESALKRSLVTFGVARGLNAVISVAQGTEVSVSPFGMGLTLAPGEVLDPVNDLVERFSGFMLVSTVALGSQRVLLEISAWIPFSIALVVFGVLLLLSQLLWRDRLSKWRPTFWKVFLVLAVIRFVFPLAVMGSEWMYQSFLQNRHIEAEAGIAEASERVRAINTERGVSIPQDSGVGAWDNFKDWAANLKTKAASAAQLSRYSNELKETARDTIELLVVFFLHTFAFPLLIILGIWRLSQWAFSRFSPIRPL